jgi:8-amino-7-oxononanoate synthase
MLDDELRSPLEEKARAGLRRSVRPIPGGVLDLASNDYLGLAMHPEVIEASCAAARRYGAGATASRLVSGHNALHAELEAELATWKGTESALVFPSGYMANLAAITALARPSDTIYCDKRNHASLIDGCRLAAQNGALVRYYGTLDKLKTLLLSTPTNGRRIIVSDAVYSMDGDLCDGPRLFSLAIQVGAIVILDDAHGLGVLGKSGRGAIQHWCERHPDFAKMSQGVDVIHVGTLSKSLGAQGGFVAGSEVVIHWLVNSARSFIYTTGLNPAACGAAFAALHVLKCEPQRVERMRTVKTQLVASLRTLGFEAREHPTAIIPIFIGGAEAAIGLSNALLQKGIWSPAIRPPTVPVGTSRIRVTASSALTDADLVTIREAFASVIVPRTS